MAITKRGRISFDFKIVFAGDEFEEFTENLVALTKKVSLGEKISGLELAMVKAALVGGPEAAAEIAIKSGAQSFIRQEFTESGLTVGNVAVML